MSPCALRPDAGAALFSFGSDRRCTRRAEKSVPHMVASILNTICEQRRKDVAAAKEQVSAPASHAALL